MRYRESVLPRGCNTIYAGHNSRWFDRGRGACLYIKVPLDCTAVCIEHSWASCHANLVCEFGLRQLHSDRRTSNGMQRCRVETATPCWVEVFLVENRRAEFGEVRQVCSVYVLNRKVVNRIGEGSFSLELKNVSLSFGTCVEVQ